LAEDHVYVSADFAARFPALSWDTNPASAGSTA
jgi:hypothetical protein